MGKSKRNYRVSETREERLEGLRRSRENLLTMNKPRKSPNKSFTAKYTGTECAGCFTSITKGDTVRYDVDGNLVHARHSKTEEVYYICDSCFLTKPCECED